MIIMERLEFSRHQLDVVKMNLKFWGRLRNNLKQK